MAFNRFLLIIIAAFFSLSAAARGLDDLEADSEDVMNESESAVAESGEAKEKIAQEKSKATARKEKAASAFQSAAAKRQAAVEQMQREEAEIENANSEVERLKGELVKEEKEFSVAKEKLDKRKGELQALLELKLEKSQRLQEIAAEKDKMALETKEVELQRVQAEADFNRLKVQEKTASEDWEKHKTVLAAKKAQLQNEIAEIKSRMPAAVAAATPAATAKPVASPTATATVADADPETGKITVKRQCRVFDKVGKDAKVVGVQQGGAEIVKRREGKAWITFSMDDGREGYVAKRCLE